MQKKYLFLLLALTVAFCSFLIACSPSNTNSSAGIGNESASSQSEASAEEAIVEGEQPDELQEAGELGHPENDIVMDRDSKVSPGNDAEATGNEDMEKLISSFIGYHGELSIEEKLVYLVVKSGLDKSWDNANENDSDSFICFYEYLCDSFVGEITLPEGTEQIPAEELELIILAYFDLDVEHIRKSSYYNADSNTYEIVGLGGAANARIIEIEEQENQKTFFFERYQDVEFLGTGELTVSLIHDNSYEIVSCKTTY